MGAYPGHYGIYSMVFYGIVVYTCIIFIGTIVVEWNLPYYSIRNRDVSLIYTECTHSKLCDDHPFQLLLCHAYTGIEEWTPHTVCIACMSNW